MMSALLGGETDKKSGHCMGGCVNSIQHISTKCGQGEGVKNPKTLQMSWPLKRSVVCRACFSFVVGVPFPTCGMRGIFLPSSPYGSSEL